MLYGLAGEVGRTAAETTEANQYAAAAGFLSYLSAMVGRDVCLSLGNIWHHARLYLLHVARSRLGRKQESLALTRRIDKALRQIQNITLHVMTSFSLLGQIHRGRSCSPKWACEGNQYGLNTAAQPPRGVAQPALRDNKASHRALAGHLPLLSTAA
jgi:hypothetical protein